MICRGQAGKYPKYYWGGVVGNLMKLDTRELIRAYSAAFSSGSFLSAWKLDADDVPLLFGLFTTKDFGDVEISPSNGLLITSKKISESGLLSFIPEALDEEIQIEFSVDLLEGGSVTFDEHRQPRICRRTSQEMEGFGLEYPALCVEYWPRADLTPSIEEEQEIALRDSLKNQFGVDLDEHHEYLGALLGAVEDRRGRVRFNESNRELSSKLLDDVEALNRDEILDLHDTWIIEVGSVPVDELEITIRREEFGQLLNEIPVDLANSNRISEDAAIEYIRSEQRSPSRLAVISDSTERYELPEIPAPGASAMILKITCDGVLIDEYRMPLMRQIDMNVDVLSGSSPSPSADTPDLIFEDADHTVGRYGWDHRLALSGESDLENWVVEDTADFGEVMDVVHDSLTGTVKLADPFLRPPDLSDLVAEADTDINMWVMTALYRGEMSNLRQDFEDIVSSASQDGKDLHITWVPDSPTPLHDRFLLSEERSLTLGTSFNSLDSNLTVVHEIDEEKAAQLERNFDFWWTDPRFNNENDVELIASTY